MGVARSNPDYEKLDVMNTVLGGLFSSRINLNLREDKGYSYGAFSFIGQNRGVGPVMAGAAARPGVPGPPGGGGGEGGTNKRGAGGPPAPLPIADEPVGRPPPP